MSSAAATSGPFRASSSHRFHGGHGCILVRGVGTASGGKRRDPKSLQRIHRGFRKCVYCVTHRPRAVSHTDTSTPRDHTGPTSHTLIFGQRQRELRPLGRLGPLGRPSSPPCATHGFDDSEALSTKAGNIDKNGVFSLLLINFAVHIAGTYFFPTLGPALSLSHMAPKWTQFVTAAFVHANWDHLFSNAFSLLVFGRMVEEEEGAFGLWVTYLVCGVAGNIASYLSAPGQAVVSLGASSAVFGLFAVGVLTKIRLDFRRLLESVVLGAFVYRQLAAEVGLAVSGGAQVGGMQVGHIAHMGGALGGVLLVLLLSRLPKVDS